MNVPFVDLHAQYLTIKPEIDAAIAEVIKTSAFIRGPLVQKFEEEFATAMQRKHCVSCANGTDSLYIAMHGLGLKPGDEVIAPAHSWISTSETITQAGGKVVFVDTDPDTFTIDPRAIESKITKNTVGIIPVHLYGQPADMDPIMAIAQKSQLWVLEDCAQAHFARYKGKLVGTFGDAASFSFYPGKNLGALGEGGAILTNALEVSQSIKLMRDWGASEKYNHIVWGGNFRLESIQAAFLRIKLRELRKWTIERQQIANTYNQELNSDVLMNALEVGASHVYHIYAIHTQKRDEMSAALREASIGFGLHYPKAIHQQAAYSEKVRVASSLDNAEWLSNSTLSLPIFPGQKSWEVKQVIEVVNHFGMVI